MLVFEIGRRWMWAIPGGIVLHESVVVSVPVCGCCEARVARTYRVAGQFVAGGGGGPCDRVPGGQWFTVKLSSSFRLFSCAPRC